MRLISTVFLLLASTLILFSQEITVGSIPTVEDERGTQFVIGKKGEKTYVFRIPNDHKARGINVYFGKENAPMFSSRSEKSFGVANSDEAISNVENYFTKTPYYYLDIYDSQMNLITSKKIDALIQWNKKYRNESKIIFPRKIFFKDGEIMVISTYYESDINKLSIGYSKLDEEGNLGKNLNVFTEISSNNNDIEKQFRFQFTADSSNLLIYGKSEDKNKTTFILITKLFETTNFKLIQENEFSFSQKNYSKIEDVKTDNYCNLWVLMQRKCQSEIHQKGTIPYFDYNLFCCQKGNNNLSEIDIKISETNQIQYLTLETDNIGIYLSGSYSPKSSSDPVGIFLQKIDSRSLQNHFNYTIPFSQKLSKSKTNFFHTRQIKQFNNNHHLIIAENYHTMLGLEPNGSLGSGMQKRAAYGQYLYLIYEDILLVDLNDKGEVVWMETVSKSQEAINNDNESSSYLVNIANDKISLLYNTYGFAMRGFNDNELPESELKLIEFDHDGTYTVKELYRDISTKTSMIPKVSKIVGSNEIILYNNCNEKKFRYSKVTL